MTAVGVIGPGRAGLGVGVALARAGYPVAVHGRRPLQAVPNELEATFGGTPPWLSRVDVVLVAVPDDAVTGVAATLAATGRVRSAQVVLHLSGALGREALVPLEATGAALGSLHPLQTLSDPETAPQRLRGAIGAVEGDARAIEMAAVLAEGVGLRPVRLAPGGRARYHAGAVFGSNYVLVLAAVARRLLEEAGVPAEEAGRGVAALLIGTAHNLQAAFRPDEVLTGPVARGDVETIRRHLTALSRPDADLYSRLARAALPLAALSSERRAAIESLFTDGTSPW